MERTGYYIISLEYYQEIMGDVADSTISLEDNIDGKILLDQLLCLLTPRQQEILLLTVTGYKRHKEIASIMGVSVSAIEKQKRKIRIKIEEFLRRSV